MKDGRVIKRTRRRSGSINDENWVIDRHLGDDGFCTKTTMAAKTEMMFLIGHPCLENSPEHTLRTPHRPRS